MTSPSHLVLTKKVVYRMNANKYKQFVDFIYSYKLPKLTKKLSDSDLISLYMEYAPHVYSSDSNTHQRAIAMTMVFMISEEIKDRHPNNVIIQHWDVSKPIDLVTALSLA